MLKFIRHDLIISLKNFLHTGTSPDKLAHGIAWGVVLGIIPLLGVNTILCIGVAFLFRINIAVIQLINYLVYPIQLLLFIPFIKSGIYIFGIGHIPYSIDVVVEKLQTDFINTMQALWVANLTGVLLWLVSAPVLYFLLVYFGRHLIRKMGNTTEK